MDSAADVRASDDERQQAVDALSEHTQTSRLSLGEFDQRAAAANAAQFRGEIIALFKDLPEPHPHFDEPHRSAEVASQISKAPATTSGALRAAAYGLFPCSGIIALVLMFATGSWLWLLVVPPAAYLARELAKKR